MIKLWQKGPEDRHKNYLSDHCSFLEGAWEMTADHSWEKLLWAVPHPLCHQPQPTDPSLSFVVLYVSVPKCLNVQLIVSCLIVHNMPHWLYIEHSILNYFEEENLLARSIAVCLLQDLIFIRELCCHEPIVSDVKVNNHLHNNTTTITFNAFHQTRL